MEKAFEPAALRGLGFAQIELNDLSAARKAFRESLRLGHQDQARRFLAGAEKVLEQVETPGAKPPIPWHARGAAKRLSTEARSLVGETPATPKRESP